MNSFQEGCEKMIYCPVCQSRTNPNKAKIKVHYKGELYYPCCPLCQARFEKEPEKYAGKAETKGRKIDGV
jgi:YHS domain-containing protein